MTQKPVDLLCKLMGWFLYDRDVCHERVNAWCPLKDHTKLNKTAAENC